VSLRQAHNPLCRKPGRGPAVDDMNKQYHDRLRHRPAHMRHYFNAKRYANYYAN